MELWRVILGATLRIVLLFKYRPDGLAVLHLWHCIPMSVTCFWLFDRINTVGYSFLVVFHLCKALPGLIDFYTTQHFIKLILQGWWENTIGHYALTNTIFIIFNIDTIAANFEFFELTWVNFRFSHIEIILIMLVRRVFLQICGLSDQWGGNSLLVWRSVWWFLEIKQAIDRLAIIAIKFRLWYLV